MVKIGKLEQKEKDSKTITLEGLYLKENIFEKEFIISGKFYKIDIQSTIKFFTPIDELSDNEIDDAIDNIPSYRFTFLSIQADLERLISQLSRKLKNWLAIELEEIKNDLENKKARSSQRITDKEVFAKFIKEPSNETRYNEEHDEIDFYQNQLTLVKGLNEILAQRGWFLKTWAENRLLVKRGKGRDASI